ncbi:hypothetical protein MSG28_013251 [Choristoneura fumiferana]|uniref:Uncharacterized protein n=1 Tax=Choristoneura fumiferana TaxID=7141 RepID=A0ACC0KT43_CHOFU|nr:hypothetical protein MSG28_013251 [Choristoneura fumiferana]
MLFKFLYLSFLIDNSGNNHKVWETGLEYSPWKMGQKYANKLQYRGNWRITWMVVGLHRWNWFSMIHRSERHEGSEGGKRRVGRELSERRVQRVRRRRVVRAARQARRARIARAHAARRARSFAFAGPGNITPLYHTINT